MLEQLRFVFDSDISIFSGILVKASISDACSSIYRPNLIRSIKAEMSRKQKCKVLMQRHEPSAKIM